MKIIKELQNTLDQMIRELNLPYRAKEILNNHQNEIFICLMCLIHSHEFELYDEKIGSCVMEMEYNKAKSKWQLVLRAKIYFGKYFISWPIMLLDDNVHIYFEALRGPNNQEFKIDGFNAMRTREGKLIVTKLDE